MLNLALVGAWIAVTLDMAVRMVLVLKRFSSGVFKKYSKQYSEDSEVMI
jgi:Na+-driven multidrug efflux pump